MVHFHVVPAVYQPDTKYFRLAETAHSIHCRDSVLRELKDFDPCHASRVVTWEISDTYLLTVGVLFD